MPKALNILLFGGHTDWGADESTLLKLYPTPARDDHGTSTKDILKELDPIDYQRMCIAFGNLPNLSNSKPLRRRLTITRKLTLKIIYELFFLRVKNLPENLYLDPIISSSLSEVFMKSKT